MKVLLKPGEKAKVSTIKSRVYLLGNNSQLLIDDTFDKMYK